MTISITSAAEHNVPTETIIKALYILADDIHSDDGVANAAIRQAARRMETLEKEHAAMKDTLLAVSSGDGCSLHQCGLWASDTLSSLSQLHKPLND